ncbi:MAG: hypothetical protein JKY56_24695 [Kofleriaceae bacterium]|nr:hypothetical protein [Kofleriaceae bacterium]
MHRLRFVSLLSLVLATGCYSTHSLTVVPREILRHVPALRDQGEAMVDTLDGTEYRLDANKNISIVVDGEPITQSVGEFVANCPDIPPFAGDTYRRERPCYLLDTSTSQITVEKTSSFDSGKTRTLINTVVVLGGGVGLGFCLSECATEGKIAAGAGLVGLGLYGLLLVLANHNSR